MASSRRQFLFVAGGTALLAACGSDGGSTSTSPTAASPTASTVNADGTLPSGFGVVQRFPNVNLFTPGEVRLPISITDGNNLMATGPARLTGWIETFDGTRAAEVDAPRRDQGVAYPYWEVRATLEKAVIHTLRFNGDDGYGATFEVWDPGDVKSPLTGNAMPPFDTPTVDDHRGVEPYCSRTPEPCPLHDVTLTQALASGKPVAYMVGTPAHCQTGTCAPGLELLIAEHERLGDTVVMVHADVYTDDTATQVAPAVAALNVDYEPIIYFCDAKGVVVDRLDGVWDEVELRERFDLLLS